MIRLLHRFSLLILVMLSAACASWPEEQGPVWPYPEPPETEDWGYEGRPSPTPRPKPQVDGDYRTPPPGEARQAEPAVSSHPTVQSLVDQAEHERAAGELERAAGTLERAIRIVNNDPLPWLKLAEIRFEQGQLIQAENLARRSLSFRDSGATARDSWLLISDIKRLQGDAVAAEQARQRAMQIR